MRKLPRLVLTLVSTGVSTRRCIGLSVYQIDGPVWLMRNTDCSQHTSEDSVVQDRCLRSFFMVQLVRTSGLKQAYSALFLLCFSISRLPFKMMTWQPVVFFRRYVYPELNFR